MTNYENYVFTEEEEEEPKADEGETKNFKKQIQGKRDQVETVSSFPEKKKKKLQYYWITQLEATGVTKNQAKKSK